MAALLRSARLLKSSPVSLLQIAGANKHGSVLSRLYSGTVVARGVVRPTYPWSLAAVRHFAVAPKQVGVSKDERSSPGWNRPAPQFDWALTRLDTMVRRTGRITKSLLMSIFHDACCSGNPSGNQALLLLRSCGSLLAEVPMSKRTDMVHQIWDQMEKLGVSYDVSHYNALLKVYLQNEFKFSPTDFLAKMEAANVQPNRVTYQRLIAAYCQEGDIEGTSKVLGFMKSKDLPITEAVFNSLITGHARAGDMESAANILPVMRGAGLEPGPDSYLALLNAYAEKADMERIRELLEAMEKGDVALKDRDFMQVLLTLAKAGHTQHVPEILGLMKHEWGYVPDAMNLCLTLITLGLEDTAFTFLRSFPSMPSDERDSPGLGNFFLRHCIEIDMPLEKITQFCSELQNAHLHSSPFQFTLHCALSANKADTAVQLMKKMKEEGLPIRPHYFWPLLAQYQKDNNKQGAVELLKSMQDLGVLPDIDTYYLYILPSFSSPESACTALQEAGCTVDSKNLAAAQLRSEAGNRSLADVYAMMSSPTFPPIDLNAFRGSLIVAFRKSSDVEHMAKITELLFRDSRFCRESRNPTENAVVFLSQLIEGMSVTEIQAQKEQLRKYFQQLKSLNITIPANLARGIRSQLASSPVPDLAKDVMELVDPNAVQDFNEIPSDASGGRVLFFQKRLEYLKAAGEPLGPTLKQLIHALAADQNLGRALELKEQHAADMTVESYAVLIGLCCRVDKPEDALQLKRELSQKDPSATLDAGKYLLLAKVLSKHGRTEEAVEMLKEMKEKEVALSTAYSVSFGHLLNAAAQQGDVDALRRLQEAIFHLGLAKPSNSLCSPLITLHLDRGDHAAAVEEIFAFSKQYNLLPRLHGVLCVLVEKGETDLLQKVMDVLSEKWGERMMLYDLFFAFLQTGKYREARKIMETPGLTARPGRFRWFADRCIAQNQMEPLENMVEMTGKLFECDRDQMYHYLLRLCNENNDWQKAEAIWTKMQEENVVPRERTLLLLASILKKNGQEVPFDVPEVWYEEAAAAQPEASPPKKPVSPPVTEPPKPPKTPASSASDYSPRVLTLCRKGKPEEAYEVLEEAEKKDVMLTATAYNALIKAQLSLGNMKDAMAIFNIAASRIEGFSLSEMAQSLQIITQLKNGLVKDAQESLMGMIRGKKVPSQLAVTRLVQGLASQGNVQGIQEVENAIKGLSSSRYLSGMLFVNNYALAHINSGNLETAVEDLEALFTSGSDSEEDDDGPVLSSISYVFRTLISNNNQDALDRLSAMAERLANHFSNYRPATDLFLVYMDLGRTEDAKFLLERCGAIAEQKQLMVNYMTKAARSPGQANKLKILQELVPDFVEKDVYWAYLIKCYTLDNDLASAKALYLRMQEEGATPDELTLKRLAALYTNAQEPVPFEEPPESYQFYAQKLKQKTKGQSSAAEA